MSGLDGKESREEKKLKCFNILGKNEWPYPAWLLTHQQLPSFVMLPCDNKVSFFHFLQVSLGCCVAFSLLYNPPSKQFWKSLLYFISQIQSLAQLCHFHFSIIFKIHRNGKEFHLQQEFVQKAELLTVMEAFSKRPKFSIYVKAIQHKQNKTGETLDPYWK